MPGKLTRVLKYGSDFPTPKVHQAALPWPSPSGQGLFVPLLRDLFTKPPNYSKHGQ